LSPSLFAKSRSSVSNHSGDNAIDVNPSTETSVLPNVRTVGVAGTIFIQQYIAFAARVFQMRRLRGVETQADEHPPTFKDLPAKQSFMEARKNERYQLYEHRQNCNTELANRRILEIDGNRSGA
jgi:hypothetical protein